MEGSLKVDVLSVQFGQHFAVRDATLHADRAGWWGVLGANGSGKTTLLRTIAGRLAPQAGCIGVNGENLTDAPEKRAALIGYAPPQDSLPETLTAAELLSLAARARKAKADRPAGLYEALGLARLANLRIGEMSSGMRQRVALFCAFLGSPEVVLLDEPFNWLDPVADYDLKTWLTEYAGAAVVITALHDVATFSTRCCGGILMHDGETTRTFNIAEIERARSSLPAFEREVYEALGGRRATVYDLSP